jgi:hypothetical protein
LFSLAKELWVNANNKFDLLLNEYLMDFSKVIRLLNNILILFSMFLFLNSSSYSAYFLNIRVAL